MKLSLRKWFLAALVMIAGTALAEEVKFDFSVEANLKDYVTDLPDWKADGGTGNFLIDLTSMSYQGVNVEFTKLTSTANPARFYKTGTADVKDLRIYNNTTTTVSAPEGMRIDKVVFNCPDATGSNATKMTADVGNLEFPTNKVVSWTPAEGAETTKIVFSPNTTIRVADLTVTFSEATGEGGGEGEETDPEPEVPVTYPTLYVLGAGNGIGWDFPGKSYDAVNGQYVLDIKNLTKFKVSTVKATTWEGDGQFNSGSFGWNTNELQLGDAVASAAGQTVNLEPWGEDLEMPWTGDYVITISGDLKTMNVKTTTPKPTTAPVLFFRGDMNGWGSSPNANYTFTNVSYGNNQAVYTWTGTLNAGQAFKIDDGTWGQYNYSFNNQTLNPELNKVYNLAYNSGDSKLSTKFTGTITLTISNISGHVATAVFSDGSGGEVKYAENYYLIGTIDGQGWNPTNVAKMAGNGEGIYTIEGVTLSENGGSTGFAITAFDGSRDDWNAVNAERYGPAVKDTKAVIGENKVDGMGDLSWTIDPGTYNMTFDYPNRTLTISGAKAEVVIPEVIYLRGGAGDDSWADNTANAMAKLEAMTGDGGYQYQAKFDAITDEFKFASDPISWDNLVLNMGAGDNRVATNHGTLVAVHDGQNFQVAEGGLKNVTVTFIYAPEGTSRVSFEAEEVVPTITLGDVTVSDVTDATATITAAYTAENVVAPNAVFVEFTDGNTRQMTRVAGEDGKAELKLEGLTAETKYQYMVVARVLNTAEGYNTVTSSNINYPEFTTTAAPVVEPELGLKEVWTQNKFAATTNNNVRSAAGFGGKVYYNDQAAAEVKTVDGNGKVETFAKVDGIGTAISTDDAGNVIVLRGIYAASGTSATVIKADGSAQENITLSMPEGVTGAQTMMIGRAIGDIYSETGGYIYLSENTNTRVAMLEFKNGKQTGGKASFEVKNPAIGNTTIAQPILNMDEIAVGDAQALATATKISDPENYFAIRNRSDNLGSVVLYNGTATGKVLPSEKSGNNDGFAVFKLGGEIYQIIPAQNPAGGSYSNTVNIYNPAGEIIESISLGDTNTASGAYHGILARPISETQAEIYILYSGSNAQSAAMYTYTIEAPAPAEPTLELGEMTAETTATTATVTVNYTAENLPEGGKVVAQVSLNTDKRETVTIDGVDGKAVAEFTELAPETEYQYMVTAYVVDAKGNQNYETRRTAQNAFTTEKALEPATFADRVNASVEQDMGEGAKTYDYTLEYSITRNADKTLTISANYTLKGDAPVGYVDTHSIYIDQTADGGRIDDVTGVKDGEAGTTTKTFEDGDVVYVEFAKAIALKNMTNKVEYTVGSEQEMPVNYDITGNMTAQADMNIGTMDEPDLGDVEEFVVKAAYIDGKLMFESFADHAPLTFTVNVEDGSAVSEEGVIANTEDEQDYMYTDFASKDQILYATIRNISEEPAKSVMTVEPWGMAAEFPDYGLFFNPLYYNTVIELDYCFEGVPFMPEIAIDKAEASNVTRTTAVISVTPEFKHKPEGAKVIVSATAEGAEAVEEVFEGESGESASILLQGLTENTPYTYTVNAVIKADDQVLAQAEAVEVTFTTEEAYTGEERTLVDKNVYAYDIKVKGDNVSKVATISYKLNGKTKEVKIQALINGEPVTAADGVTEGTTNYDNEVEVTYPAEVKGTLTFEITAVPENTVTQATVIKDVATSNGLFYFYGPYGVAVNNCPDSETFGQIVALENRYISKPTSNPYHSFNTDKDVMGGLYAFTPLMEPVKNENNGYCFDLGLGANNENKVSVFGEYHRIKYTADGRLYLTTSNKENYGIYEIDDTDLDAPAQPVMEEKGLSVWGMDIYGTGDNRKVVFLSTTNGEGTGNGVSNNSAAVYSYDMSENNTLSNQKFYANLSGTAYNGEGNYNWISPSGINIAIDPDGQGFYIIHGRGADQASSQARAIHASMEDGTVDELVTKPDGANATFVPLGACIAYNKDYTLLAMATASATVSIYQVSDVTPAVENSAAPAPKGMTKVLDLKTSIGPNSNAVAFDYANNIYLVSNSGEKLISFQLPAEIAGESATVPAPKAMAVDIDTTAVGNILVDAEEGNAVYYNLNGIQMPANAKLPTGVYVKVVGNTATKVVVK